MATKTSSSTVTAGRRSFRGQSFFLIAVGTFLGITLLKFGNPVIFDDRFGAPSTFSEGLYQPWPQKWGYGILTFLWVAGLPFARWKFWRNADYPWWLATAPGAWLMWQCLAATQTVDQSLTVPVLKHFIASTACFYLGLIVISRTQPERFFLILLPLGAAFVVVLRAGITQHFGGLEETRRYFYSEILPNLGSPPAEFLAKLSSKRIFATLFYPNTLAGAILLLLPITCSILEPGVLRMPRTGKVIIGAMIGLAALACLYWSGSKSGWLLMLALAVALALRAVKVARWRRVLVLLLVVGGLAGFFVAYSEFFARGAGSVGARLDYWRSAIQTTAQNPVLGTGPGTFSVSYRQRKAPEAEMARLAHNDYLEQASDSGIPGFLFYCIFVFGVMYHLYRYRTLKLGEFLVFLGLCGLFAQGLTEFNLYVPALTWIGFLLMGTSLGRSGPETNRQNSLKGPKGAAR